MLKWFVVKNNRSRRHGSAWLISALVYKKWQRKAEICCAYGIEWRGKEVFVTVRASVIASTHHPSLDIQGVRTAVQSGECVQDFEEQGNGATRGAVLGYAACMTHNA